MSFLPEGVETTCLQLAPFLQAGTLQYDKNIRLQRDVGNCPSSTTDVPGSERQLSSVRGNVALGPCHLYGAPPCPEGHTFQLRATTAVAPSGNGAFKPASVTS